MRKTSKRSTKKLAFFLAILMVFCSIPIEGFAIYDPSIIDSDNETYDCPKSVNVTQETDPVLILHEEADLREAESKHYRMSNGTFTAVKYNESIHYKDEDGKLQDIDNTLVVDPNAKDNTVYTNRDNDVKYTFEGTPGNGLVSAQFDKYKVSFDYIDDIPESKDNAPETVEEEEELEPIIVDDLEDTDSVNDVIESDDTVDTTVTADDNNELEEYVISEENVPINDEIVDSEDDNTAETTEGITVDTEEAVHAEEEEHTDVPSAGRTYEIEITNPHGTSPYVPLDKTLEPNNAKNTDGKLHPYTLDEANERLKVVSVIKYTDPTDGFAFKYNLAGRDLKESIIVNTPTEKYSYKFALDFDALTPVTAEDGSIELINSEGKVIFVIAVPYMFDANYELSYDVSYEIENDSENGYIFTVSADSAWIDAEERAFPVTIDPTLFVIGNGYSSSFDIKYRLGTGTIYTNTIDNYLGKNGYSSYYSFFQITSLPALPNNCMPVRAKIKYYQLAFTKNNSSYSPNEFIIATREATSASTWYNNPKTNDIMDYQVVKSSTVNSYLSWDITEAIQNWYSGSTNNGVVFTNETTFNGSYGSYAKFDGNNASSNYLPYIEIHYRNMVGVESYYSYLTQNVGRAGTGYVRANDGKMTFSKSHFSNTGTAQSFTLSHIFNSAYAAYKFVPYTAAGINTLPFSGMNVGYGWKLNIQQTIVDKTINNLDYKIYVDEDGTEHYFYKDPNDYTLFKDEDGLGLKIKVNNATTMTMSDDKDNKKVFKNGYLYQIIDANNNTITIKYGNLANGNAIEDDGVPSTLRHRIVRVTQTITGETEKTIATLTYNAAGFLIEVSDENSHTTTITYNNERIIRFTHPDGTQAKYIYNSTTGNMDYAYDAELQYGISFAYGSTYFQVSSFTEFVCTASNFGTSSTYSYGAKYFVGTSGKNKTIVRYTGADRTVCTADDIVTTYLFDSFGRTVNTYSSNAKPDDTYAPFRIYGTSVSEYTPTNIAGSNCKSNNRISGEVLTGSMPINYVSNPGAQADVNPEWSKPNTTDVVVDRTTIEKHTGTHSFFLKRTATSISNAKMYQTKGLNPGSYTFSAYVKTDFISNPGSGGAFLSVWNADEGIVYSRIINDTTNEDIENGWERISVSFTVSENANPYYQITAHLNGVIGTAYYDDFQLEEAEGASNTNLLNNSTIEDCDISTPTVATSWTTRDGVVQRCYDKSMSGSASLKVSSNINTYSVAKNVVDIYDTATNCSFVLGGWAWAKSVPLKTGAEDTNDAPKFKLFAKVNYSDNSSEYKNVSFNPDIRGEWQYVSLVFVPSKAVDTIEVCCFYANNAGVAYFDNISLIRESSQTYKYDSDGNLIKVNGSGVDESSDFSYENANLIASTFPGAGTYKYEYKTTGNRHLLEKVTNEMGTTNTSDDLTMEVKYTLAGTTNKTKLYSGQFDENTSIYMSTDATYINKNYILSHTDINKIKTEYVYENAQIAEIKKPVADALDESIQKASVFYTYNNSGRNNITRNTNDKLLLTYNYTNGLLSNTERKGEYENSVKYQTYSFTHDEWGNTTITKAGTSTIATYAYAPNNGNLTTITYGSGATVGYTYDYLDRIKTVSYDNILKYTYYYDGSGSLAHAVENDSNTEIFYQYDCIGRLVSQLKYDFSTNVPERIDAEFYTYDEYARENNVISEANGDIVSSTYSYNDFTGSIDELYNEYSVNTTTSTDTITYSYDELNRLDQKSVEFNENANSTIAASYTYRSLGGNRTGTQVSTLTHVLGNSTPSMFKYNYTYNRAGNIKQITTGSGSNKVRYYYDNQNQLIMETNNYVNKTFLYLHDTYGNIREKRTLTGTGITDYQTAKSNTSLIESSYTYSYTNSDFKDMLTSYNGTTISYDSMGNPLNWTNGRTLTWSNGRTLSSFVDDMIVTTYTYNGDGLRTVKTYDNTVFNYYYNGNRLAVEEYSYNGLIHTLHFLYDANGSPYAFVYNNGTVEKVYYYITNLQGDVTAIVDQNLNVVATYTYDAWGNILNTYNSNNEYIGNINPLRYRGYYYDFESDWYYINGIYYDPEICRLITANDTAILGDTSSLTSRNIYSYCNPNPVNTAANTSVNYNNTHFALSQLNDFYLRELPVLKIKYNVPLYEQEGPYCWTYCQVMNEVFHLGEACIPNGVKNRVEEIYRIKKERENPMNSTPTDVSRPYWLDKLKTPTLNQLFDFIQEYGPIYAVYDCTIPGEKGHLVLVVGVDLANGIIYTNNPWGYSGGQTLNEFYNSVYRNPKTAFSNSFVFQMLQIPDNYLH